MTEGQVQGKWVLVPNNRKFEITEFELVGSNCNLYWSQCNFNLLVGDCFLLSLDWSLEILSLCKEFAKDGVVGIDLAGDESLGEIPAMKGHVIAFKVCLFWHYTVCLIMLTNL